MRTSRRTFLFGAGAAALLVACGEETNDATAPSADTEPTSLPVGLDGDLPPVDALDLEPLLGPPLAELGLRLTDRGGLIDTRNGQYVKSATGNHVALYAEPVGEYTNDQFIEGILAVTVLSAPAIFERWPAVESYDICQEPRAVDDPSDEPIPATQIFMTNEQSAAIDWDTVTLADLLAATLTSPPTVDRILVSKALQAEPRYAALLAEAQAQAIATP